MNFQMNEVVESPDAELVSRVLETCLRAQWNEVARAGDTIVLRGLGPSHRVNRNDRAVFAVKPAEGGRTAIEADVTYQASALVGASTPQNELVQRKLDGVLELVRLDLDLARRKATQSGDRESKPWIVNRSPATTGAGGFQADSQVGTKPAGKEQALVAEAAAKVAEQKTVVASAPAPAVPATESALAARADDGAAQSKIVPEMPSEFARLAARLAAAGTSIGTAADAAAGAATGASRSSAIPAAREAPRKAAPAAPRILTEQSLVHRGEEDDDPEERRASAGKIFAVLLVVFVLAGVGEVGWEYRVPVQQRVASLRAAWAARGSAAPATSANPAAKAEPQPDPAELARAAEAAKLAESDPKQWLANWAGALAGQDAVEQAAYYADPVDKYFLRKGVTRAAVLADKTASIAKRSGPWTLTLDDVVVAQQTDAAARILMVKHIVTRNGAGERIEERLPTQIRLKKIDGQWRIGSEQTLG